MNMKNTAILSSLVLATVAGVTYYPKGQAEIIQPAPLTQPIPVTLPVKTAQHEEKPLVEVVFVLDTTGSMGGMIQAAKEKIWSIATTLSSAQPAPEIRIGLVAYRDRGDAYITQVTDLSTDLDDVFRQLMALEAQGGGDSPESVNQALNEAIEKISWSKNTQAYQTIFLVGDAPAHTNYSQDVQYSASLKNARNKNIIVNAIQCGEDGTTKTQWTEIAQLGSGKYLKVSQEGSALKSDTPFDHKISSLGKELESTRMYYGTKKERGKSAERNAKSAELYASAPASSLAKRAEYNVSESGSKNLLGDKELLGDIEEGKIKIEDLDKTLLPETLAAMEHEEQVQFVESNIAKRKKLVSEIEALTEQRQAYLKNKLSEKSEAKSSLDFQLFDAIKKQASERGISYDADDLSL